MSLEPGNAPDSRAAEVLRLHYLEGTSIRLIAKKMGLARKTVRQILGRTPALPATPRAPRACPLDAYRDAVRTMLSDAPEMRATTVLERLRAVGYRGGITVVRDLVRELRPRAAREVFLTLQHTPGEMAQVDWADFGYALPGCPRRVSAFVMVLAYSRMLHLEFTLSQSQGSLLRCIERASRFYGGITHVDVFDNMRTVVLEHKTTPVFHPRFVQYAAARGFAVTACRPRTPTGKPDVERGIGFVRERFWPGRRFASLLDLNRQAASWRDDFANARVHETTGKIPALVFEHEEKKRLAPLPRTPFDTDDIFGTGITKTFRVSFDRNRYSVPPRLVSQSVVVRGDDDTVRIFLATKEVAVHARSWGIGEDIEHPTHRLAALATKQRPDASTLPAALDSLGETGRTYARLFAASSRSVQREMVRIVFLVELFGASATASAIDEVMKTGHVGAEYVEYVLRHKRGLVPAPPPLRLGQPDLDSLSLSEPDLSTYDRLFATRKTSDPEDAS
jgi:transposase